MAVLTGEKMFFIVSNVNYATYKCRCVLTSDRSTEQHGSSAVLAHLLWLILFAIPLKS